ncbi:Transmembrane protein 194A, partial [Habropoda laboriosa]
FLKPGVVFQNNEPVLKIFCHNGNTKTFMYMWKSLTGKIMYRMVATSWTMSVYIIQALWAHAHIITVEYREWITLYILLTSFISFIICYWFGPITNARTKKVIQWFLALFAMYHSSYFREVSIFSCIVIILLYNCPIVAIRKVRSYW